MSLASITHIIEANDNGALAGETRVIDATSGKVANLDKLARILDEDEGKLTERMRTMVGRARSAKHEQYCKIKGHRRERQGGLLYHNVHYEQVYQ